MPLRLKTPGPDSRPPRARPRTRPDDEPSLFPLVIPPSPLSYCGWVRVSCDGKHWSLWRCVVEAQERYWSVWPLLLAVEEKAAHVERAVVAKGEVP